VANKDKENNNKKFITTNYSTANTQSNLTTKVGFYKVANKDNEFNKNYETNEERPKPIYTSEAKVNYFIIYII
jgi:hypothetical protein